MIRRDFKLIASSLLATRPPVGAGPCPRVIQWCRTVDHLSDELGAANLLFRNGDFKQAAGRYAFPLNLA